MTVIKSMRLERQSHELIDRSRTIHFTFNGTSYSAHPGDTIASALAANDVRVIARSFKYHRPRGLQAHGHSMNAMVQIGNQVSESVWLTKVEDGMTVESVNTWPSLENDFVSLTRFGDRFMPVGFYYKTFIHPQRLWPTYEKVIRNIAGLGRLDINTPLDADFDKQYLHADVVVVGGGPAGLSAAIAAATAGARTLLFDDGPALGGHLRYSADQGPLQRLIDQANQLDNLTVYTDTTVQGTFEDNWLFAERDRRLFKIRSKATVFATGAEDQPIIFDNNDLPGVMMASAAERLLHGHGVACGSEVLIVTANNDGWRLARDLVDAGVDVSGIVDQRANGQVPPDLASVNVPVTYWQHTVVKATGNTAVNGAVVAPLFDHTKWQTIPCDTILMATGWTPRYELPATVGCTFPYNEARREHVTDVVPAGVFLAGRVAGAFDIATQFAEGDYMGRAAAAYAGHGTEPDAQEAVGIAKQKAGEPTRNASHIIAIGDTKGKRFVDLDEDVTDKDVKDAIAEGYSSIELLKRYSTISMGPSQGRWSSLNTMHLVSKYNDWSMNETGKTTSRPPYRPVKFGTLGGQLMEPVRYTPLHDWHIANGASMMGAGLWMRPETYGDPVSEVRNVRENAGIIDVTTLGKIKLTGPGVPELLDKLYINKFSNLRVGRVRYGIMCTTEGVVSDDGVTARVSENEWYMTTTSGGAGGVYETIQWWAQSGWGEGVHITAVSEDYVAINLAGPKSRELLIKLGLDADEVSNRAFPYMRMREMKIKGVPCRLMRIGFTGELSYEIHAPASYGQSLWEKLLEVGEPLGIAPFGVEAQRVLRLEKGHIIVGQDTDALADPLSADLGWAVKFDKPDFLGKRSLTRIAEDGIKQRLVGFKMNVTGVVPEEGLQIVETVPASEKYPIGLNIVGWVTSSRYSPTLDETIGLCWLPKAVADVPKARFLIRRNGELIPAQVHHGAFVDPTGERLRS